MKKIWIILFLLSLSLFSYAQEGYVYGFRGEKLNYRNKFTGEVVQLYVISSVVPNLPIDKAGLKEQYIITNITNQNNQKIDDFKNFKYEPSIVISYNKPGGERGQCTVNGLKVSNTQCLTEAYWAQQSFDGQTKTLYTSRKVLNLEPIEIVSDPEIDLYSYKSFDFDFDGNNIIEQKEVAAYIEPMLIEKGLVRDKSNPDLIIVLDFFTDRKEQYVPPTQRTITRYKYGYEVLSGWGTRQYVESVQEGNYTKIDYFSRLFISFLDTKKIKENSNQAVVWKSKYEILYNKKSSPREFAQNIGAAMINGFPSTALQAVFYSPYWSIGVIFDNEKEGVVVGVIPGSPADKAGISIGDELQKSVVGRKYNSNNFPVNVEKHRSKNGVGLLSNYLDFEITRRSILIRGNKNYEYCQYYLSDYFRNIYNENNTCEFTVKKANGDKVKLTIKPEKCTIKQYFFNEIFD